MVKTNPSQIPSWIAITVQPRVNVFMFKFTYIGSEASSTSDQSAEEAGKNRRTDKAPSPIVICAFIAFIARLSMTFKYSL